MLGFEKTLGPIGPEPVAILVHRTATPPLEINLVLNAPEPATPNVLMDVPVKAPGITHFALSCPDIEAAARAIVAAGFARYGLVDMAARTMTGMFDASTFLEANRLPELFCGFKRRPGEGPTLYPVACSPQAWASGAVLLLLQASLGLKIEAPQRRVIFARPHLPGYLDRVTLANLTVGDAILDLVLERTDDDVGVTVRRRLGDVEIVTIK